MSARAPALAALLFGLALLPASGAQAPEGSPFAEGPLSNDVYLPTNQEATLALRRGDELLGEAAGAADVADARRSRSGAFDAWHDALEGSTSGESVWFDVSEDGDRRVSEGVVDAVLRRVALLDDDARSQWVERLGPLADQALPGARAGERLEPLVLVERNHPATLGAARAALALCDLGLERGRTQWARGYLERSALHLELAGAEATDLRGAIHQREAWFEERLPEPELPKEAWRDALALSPLATAVIDDPAQAQPRRRELDPQRGVRPGLVFLAPNRLAVQSTALVSQFRVEDERLVREASWDPGSLVDEDILPPELPRSAPLAPGWQHLPVTADGDLFLVHGRALRGGESNLFLAVRAPDPGRTELGPRRADALVPSLRWARSGALWWRADGSLVDDATELAELEFQPGPVVLGDLIVVGARRYGDATEAWLLAFERSSGELVWMRQLARGSDLTPDRGRFGAGAGPRLAAQPLVHRGGRIFAGTHLGAGALVDGFDGRLIWSLKNRRREPGDGGWGGDRPFEDGAGRLIWAPADSDRLYRLLPAPLRVLNSPREDPKVARDVPMASEALFAAPPLALGESEALLGADGERVVVAARAGAERVVRSLTASGLAVEGLYLGPEERFRGRGVASEGRAMVASDRGLYLFDRTRDLYLLDHRPLPAPIKRAGGASRGREWIGGGDVHAQGNLVCVLGFDALWTFRVQE